MGDAYLLVSIIIVVALIFDYTNGFHDAANAIATSVETKALRPKQALALAAIGNLVGAFISEGVAKTVGSGIIDVTPSVSGLYVVLGGVILGAVLTPSTDPLTQSLLAGAVIGLYFGGIGLVKLTGK